MNQTVRFQNAEFSVRENHTLALRLEGKTGAQTICFRDFLKKGAETYNLFHEKSRLSLTKDGVTVRTPAVEAETGESIRGFSAIYRFTFFPKLSAFHVSLSLESDVRTTGYSPKLMEISLAGREIDSFVGYETDATGEPFCHRFQSPEKNPDAVDYETLMTLTPHAAWEKLKTRPIGFRKAIALEGKTDYLAIYGGTPLYQVEAEWISVFPAVATLANDVRFFSGTNSLGAWFITEKPADLTTLFETLDKAAPALPAQSLMSRCTETIALESGCLRLPLYRTRGGIWVGALTENGEASTAHWPLFHIDLWDTKYERALLLDSGENWDRVDVRQAKNYIRITLSDPENAGVSGVSVIAEGFLSPEQNRISWKTRVINRSERWSVTNLSYPQLLAKGFDTGFSCMHSGALFPDFNKTATVICRNYPTGFRGSMAYCALYRPVPLGTKDAQNGIYTGIHDAEGNYKSIQMIGAPSGYTLLTASFEPPYQRRAGNSFTLSGEMVWQRFGGDWFDATELYRAFVHSKASWLSPLRGRPDSPAWFREMPVWIMHFMPNENPDAAPVPITLREKYPDPNQEDWYRTAIEFREQIEVPVAYHLYNWHWSPFNDDYPNYFPAHHDLKEGMRALHEADVRVVPYISGYFWDMRDRRGEDYRFEQEARPNAAKNLSGNVVYNSYASTEPDGSPVRLANMCPATAFWKDELRQVVRRLYGEYGMDGVYLDVVAASYGSCHDETHLHAPGRGDFWWKAYTELIAGLRIDAPEDFAILSETVAEVYTGILDGCLTWTWVQSGSVPAFPRVYGGRVGLFGRVFTPNKREDDAYFRFHTAQSLVYGQQLGWVHPEIVHDPRQFPFLKKLAQLRWRHRAFFAEAEMLRPPVIDGQMEKLDTEPYLRGQRWDHEVCVVAGAWEDASGNRKLFVINSGGTPADITLSVKEAEYRLPEALPDFAEQEGAALAASESRDGVRVLRVRLAPEGFGVLNWK